MREITYISHEMSSEGFVRSVTPSAMSCDGDLDCLTLINIHTSVNRFSEYSQSEMPLSD